MTFARRSIPRQFLTFSAIGALGTGLNLVILTVCYRIIGADFLISDCISTTSGIVFNYTLNNIFAFRDRRRRGFGWLIGLVSFAVTCSIGVALNVRLASYLFRDRKSVV